MTVVNKQTYHYTECGLPFVYLCDGFTIENTIAGSRVKIHDIEGLHQAIGKSLVDTKKHFSGVEIRFLRHELLLSQSSLAKLLEVSEQAVRRWENGKSDINKSAETLLRMLYSEHIGEKETIRNALQRIADLDEHIDQIKLSMTLKGAAKHKGWQKMAC